MSAAYALSSSSLPIKASEEWCAPEAKKSLPEASS